MQASLPPRAVVFASGMVLLALLLAGCAERVPPPAPTATPTPFVLRPTATPTQVVAPSLTSIEIVRSSVFVQNQVAPLTKRVSNPAAVQHLYVTALTLPLYSRPVHCELDLGLAYRVTLFEGDQIRFQGAFSGTGGCSLLQIITPAAFRCRSADAFYRELPGVLGMGFNELYAPLYTARPGSPLAPTPEEGYC